MPTPKKSQAQRNAIPVWACILYTVCTLVFEIGAAGEYHQTHHLTLWHLMEAIGMPCLTTAFWLTTRRKRGSVE